jgi:pyruvate-ferredoxin/flavodoxin oxidoreductase
VLDTEVYSNTGGQASKATPRAAVAKFASGGKAIGKKDLGMIAVDYGNVYVAQVAMGANPLQTLKAFQEAESYTGPSLILAYSHCIAHGYDLTHGLDQQKLAVDTGYWPLLRYDPRLAGSAAGPLRIDSPAPREDLAHYLEREGRFQSVKQQNPDRYRSLLAEAEEGIRHRYSLYTKISEVLKSRPVDHGGAVIAAAHTSPTTG